MEETQIHCHFDSEDALYRAYMPFLKGNGLFVRTKEEYQLGEKITLTVRLFEEPEVYTVSGQIVWITPKGSQGNKPSGVGIQFEGDNSRNLCNKIENYLAGNLNSNRLTDTL